VRQLKKGSGYRSTGDDMIRMKCLSL